MNLHCDGAARVLRHCQSLPIPDSAIFRVVMSIHDVAYFQGCTTGSLLSQLGWREDFLHDKRDFPATTITRVGWRRQASLIRRVLRSRGVKV